MWVLASAAEARRGALGFTPRLGAKTEGRGARFAERTVRIQAALLASPVPHAGSLTSLMLS